ncbi:MAG: GNAT family N-acetyltransferase, partial [Acidimicrobiales bacterium]
MSPAPSVVVVEAVTAELVGEIAALVPQLSSSASPPTQGELEQVVGAEGAALFVARDEAGRAAGMLTLVTYRIPTGVHAVIEDVVVEESASGRG